MLYVSWSVREDFVAVSAHGENAKMVSVIFDRKK
jgi:hypothetical protein